MRRQFNLHHILAVVSLLVVAQSAEGQIASPPGPNSDPVYQQLRNIGLGSETVTLRDFELKRDAAVDFIYTIAKGKGISTCTPPPPLKPNPSAYQNG